MFKSTLTYGCFNKAEYNSRKFLILLNSLNPYYFISRIKSFKGLNLVGFLSKIVSSIFYRRINYRIRNFIEDNMLFILIFEIFLNFFLVFD